MDPAISVGRVVDLAVGQAVDPKISVGQVEDRVIVVGRAALVDERSITLLDEWPIPRSLALLDERSITLLDECLIPRSLALLDERSITLLDERPIPRLLLAEVADTAIVHGASAKEENEVGGRKGQGRKGGY